MPGDEIIEGPLNTANENNDTKCHKNKTAYARPPAQAIFALL
jgi:hypothetical protein